MLNIAKYFWSKKIFFFCIYIILCIKREQNKNITTATFSQLDETFVARCEAKQKQRHQPHGFLTALTLTLPLLTLPANYWPVHTNMGTSFTFFFGGLF